MYTIKMEKFLIFSVKNWAETVKFCNDCINKPAGEKYDDVVNACIKAKSPCEFLDMCYRGRYAL